MREAGRPVFEPRLQRESGSLGHIFPAEHLDAAFAAEYQFSPVAQVTLDRNGCICRLNLAAANLLKGSRPQLLNMPFLAFVDKSYCRIFLDHLSTCLRFRRRVSTEIILASYTRSSGPVELQSVAGVDQSKEGAVCRTSIIEKSDGELLISPRDVSKCQGAAPDLHQAQDLFEEILTNNSIATAILSLKTKRFLSVNEVFGDLAGFRQSEIVHRSLSEVGWRLRTSDREDLIQRLGPHVSIRNCEAQIRVPDGRVVDVLASAKTILFGGELCVLLMLQDLTDLQRLKQDVIDISEEEHKRFSRDLHDSHCQDLTAMAFFAETIAARLDNKDPENADQIRELGDMIRKSAENVHTLAANLDSRQIEQSGLTNALKELASRTSLRFSLACTTKIDRKCRFRDATVAIHLYRIAQEAISNAARHSGAKRIGIKVRLEGDIGILQVEDDGHGFSVEKKPAGFGLRTMEYRAALIKGSLSTVSRPGTGTVVTCSFPALAVK